MFSNKIAALNLKVFQGVLLYCLTLACLLSLTWVNPNFKVNANPGFVCGNPLTNINLNSDTTNCNSDGDFSVTNVTVTNGATLNIYSKTKVELNANFTVDTNSRATIEVYIPPALIPATVAELKAILLAQHNLNFVDKNAAWSVDELTWALEALNTVKSKGGQLYDSSVLTTIERYSVMKGDGPIGDCTNTGQSTLGGIAGVYLFECKSIQIFNTILGINSRYKVSTEAESFKLTFIHEVAHAYQKKNVPKSIEFANISWTNLTYNGWTTTKKSSVTACDFVTPYLTSSYEEMAEVYTEFYINPQSFQAAYDYGKLYYLPAENSLEYFAPCGVNTPYTSTPLYQKFMMAK
jgi:hypothetical protein